MPVLPHFPDGPRTRLLVSVQSRSEAELALSLGVDLLDVKDPARGSLGSAAPETIHDISHFVRGSATQTPLSVALGELLEPHAANLLHACQTVQFLKCGFAGCADIPNWQDRWLQLREHANPSQQWVAAAYVDAAAACSPQWDEIQQAAIETGCAGLLLDTWSKTGGQLLDHISPEQVADIAQQMHRHGLFLAIAGCLQLKDLARLRGSGADVVAVRSAVCQAGQRDNPLDADRLRTWVESVHSG